jgi:hypothetical protein
MKECKAADDSYHGYIKALRHPTSGGRCCRHGLFLILESSSSSDFRRRWEGGIRWFFRFSPLSRLSKRWAPGSGQLGCSVWFLRVFWAFDARGSRAGDPQAAAVFPRLSPALEFSILGTVCGADVEGSNVESLAGGSCLSYLWQAAVSVQSPASLPHIHQVEGIYQVSSPVRGGIPQ